jgi:hypothetical protein
MEKEKKQKTTKELKEAKAKSNINTSQVPSNMNAVMQEALDDSDYSPRGGTLPLRLPTKDWTKEKAVSFVIITVNDGDSYDELFRAVPQEPPEPAVAISLWEVCKFLSSLCVV